MLLGSDLFSHAQRSGKHSRTPSMERPNFLHRSRSHFHEAKHGVSRLFEPRANSPGLAEVVSSAKPIEEETQPKYNPESFYPARLGDVLNERYKVVAKLGYGMTATVWLCKDLKA